MALINTFCPCTEIDEDVMESKSSLANLEANKDHHIKGGQSVAHYLTYDW